MALPHYNAAASVTTNISICTIIAKDVSLPPNVPIGFEGEAPMFDLVAYRIEAGSSGVGTVATFQELKADGTWGNLVAPAPITLANSTNYQNIINGPLHGLRITVSGVVGNGISYAELRGSVRQA